jgi:fatty acid hydroxylase domain-containing protein 2
MKKYKTQPNENVPFDYHKFVKGALRVLFNQTVIAISMAHFFYYIEKKLDLPQSPRNTLRAVQPFTRLIFHLFVMEILQDVLFYCCHRLLHHRLIYKHVHKIHHEWTSPIATVTSYAHWIGA